MTPAWLSACVIGAGALGLLVTTASAGVPRSALSALKAAAPPSTTHKAHEEKGGMHTDKCLRHLPPGGYPDCHTHLNLDGTWVIRRSLPGGPPTVYCPKDCPWEPAPPSEDGRKKQR